MKPDNTATQQRDTATDAQFQVIETAATPAVQHDPYLKRPSPSGVPVRAPRQLKPVRTRVRGDYLSPRVMRAIDHLVGTGCTRDEAAQAVGLNPRSLAIAFQYPKTQRYYTDALQVLRLGLRARGLHTVADLAGNAASENVKLQAAKYLDSEGKSDSTVINVGVQVNNQPGYMVDLGQQAERMHQIARQAGSSRTVLEPDE